MGARWVVAALFVMAAPMVHADLKRAMAEQNLEKRSKLAIDDAKAAYEGARDAYQKDDLQQVAAFADEIGQAVDLAYESLQQTGKNARRSPRYFKSAEQETRQLVRRIEGLQQEMSYTERPMLDKVKGRIQKVHDNLLLELMEGRKK